MFFNGNELFNGINQLKNFSNDRLVILPSPTNVKQKLLANINKKNVKILTNTTMFNFKIDKNQINILNLFDHRQKKYFEINNFKKIIFCMGGLEINRQIRFSLNKTKFQNKLIGSFYSPHINFYLSNIYFNNNLRVKPYNSVINNNVIRPYIALKNKNLMNERLMNFKCLVDSPINSEENGISKIFQKHVDHPNKGIGINDLFSKIKNKIKPSSQYSMNFSFDQTPNEFSKIILSEELDFLGVPKLEIRHKISKNDLALMKNTIRKLSVELYDQKIARFPNNFDKKFLYENISSNSHHCGGTIIGTNQNNSVVDENLRLHGLKNGYIVSSSIFKRPGGINPTFSILAFADRLVEHLLNG